MVSFMASIFVENQGKYTNESIVKIIVLKSLNQSVAVKSQVLILKQHLGSI